MGGGRGEEVLTPERPFFGVQYIGDRLVVAFNRTVASTVQVNFQ